MSDAKLESPTMPEAHRGNRLIQAFVNVVNRLVVGSATVILPDGSTYELASGGAPGPPFFRWATPRAAWGPSHSPARRLRGRPASTRSKTASGSARSSLATTPICQGMTR